MVVVCQLIIALLEPFLGVPCDYFFLLVSIEVYEVIAVACDPDKKSAVAVGMFLSIAESIFIHNVELDMVSAELEVRADKVLHAFDAFFAGKDGGEEALIEQCSA